MTSAFGGQRSIQLSYGCQNLLDISTPKHGDVVTGRKLGGFVVYRKDICARIRPIVQINANKFAPPILPPLRPL